MACDRWRRSTRRSYNHVSRRGDVHRRVRQGGIEIECSPDEHVLNAAEDVEIDLRYQCLQGVCAACSAKVEEEVDCSQDHILTSYEKDQGYALLCMSYPRSNLKVHSREEP